MIGLKDDQAVIHFMAAYHKLKNIVDDDSTGLEKLVVSNEPLKELCLDVYEAATSLSFAERHHQDLFSAPVDPKFIKAWRDYEDRFSEPLGSIWVRDLGIDLEELTQEWSDKFNRKRRIVADIAIERANHLESAFDFAAEQVGNPKREFPKHFLRRIKDGIAQWRRLKSETGFDPKNVFRRRELVPFVLVPRHVAHHHGAQESLSLFTLLQQAHDAFIFGVPFAALALMQTILEVVLREHYGSVGVDLSALINNAKSLPATASAAKLTRMHILAKHILHFERDRLQLPGDMERELLAFLHTLRALIEAAPLRTQRKNI